MGDTQKAVTVENLAKLYRIGVRDQWKDSLSGALSDFLKSPLRNFRKYRGLYDFKDVDIDEAPEAGNTAGNVLWALRDVSFSLEPGEAFGIVGRNGAGKSTLLKILSRITPPTRGRAELRGRVASLLEVGTGFHQELTGRENVYLNGTILGMRRREVDRKFDEIVDFAEVETFLDTPVKRYSSGMRVRLAFAVAAHLEPEILIVDEVLAVGDTAFQQKCLNKMQDVGQEGRTILFVSHNLPAISRLCRRGVLINQGRTVMDGPVDEVISAYLDSGSGISASREWPDPVTAPGKEVARLRAVRVRKGDGKSGDIIDIKSHIRIEMEYEVLKGGSILMPHFFLFNEEGVNLFGSLDTDPQWQGRGRPPGRYISSVTIPGNFLAEGRFYITSALITRNPNVLQFMVQSAVGFQVVDQMNGESARGDWAGRYSGVVRPLLSWETQYSQS